MRRQMQLRPSQGGKFRGPVGAPMPEENPAKAALARLPWPLGWAWARRYKVSTPLIRQACSDGYIDPHPTFSQWNLTEKGAALLGVKPPGFREEFAEAGRAMMDAIKRDEATQKIKPHGPETNWLRASAKVLEEGWVNEGEGEVIPYAPATKPVRYDPAEAGYRDALDRYDNIEPPKFSPVGDTIHINTGLNECRVCYDRPVHVVAETADLGTLLLATILGVRDRAREAMRNGSPSLPPGTKAVDDGFLISVVPTYYDPGYVCLSINVRRI